MEYTKGKWIAKDVNYTLTKRTEIWSDQDNEEPIFEIIHREVNLSECTPNAKLISKAPEMYEALKAISRIKDLLCYPLDVPFDHIDEAKAVSSALSEVESILKDLES